MKQWGIRLLVSLWVLASTSAYEIMVAYNCGSYNNVTTKYVKYTSDQMYEGLTSHMAVKKSLPASISDQFDRELLLSYRFTEQEAFSYFFKVRSKDHYLLIFKFIQVNFKNKNERVFEIMLGDETIHTVDIIADSGYGTVLHKWVEFDLLDDVIFLNKTYPVLNAYSYTKNLLKVTFKRLKGQPKVESLILVKGDDAEKFLTEFVAYEESKNVIIREPISEKYHNVPKNMYKPMTGNQKFQIEDQSLMFYVRKVYSLRFIATIIAVLFLIYHETIYKKFGFVKSGAEAETEDKDKTE